MSKSFARNAAIVGTFALGGALAVASSDARAGDPVPDGAALYDEMCASCHGPKGKGDGPQAAALLSRVPALTTLTVRNTGSYPAEKVKKIVDGRADGMRPGGSEMPKWGPILERDLGGESEAGLKALIAHIQTLQKK